MRETQIAQIGADLGRAGARGTASVFWEGGSAWLSSSAMNSLW